MYLRVLSEAGSDDWTRIVSGALLPITLTSPSEGFSGSLSIRTVAGVQVSDIAAGPCLSRSSGVHAGPGASYIVCLQLSGTGVIHQDGRDVSLLPGQAAMYAAHRPSSVEFGDGFRALSLQVPAESLDLPLGTIDHFAAGRLDADPGLLILLREYLGQLTHSLDEMLPHSRIVAVEMAVGMLGALLYLQSEARGGSVPADGRRRDLRRRIIDHIEDNLGDAALDPTGIARAHFISVRLLHDLFAQEGESVAAYIRRRRLQRCARDLSNPALVDDTVALIAWRWGFESASHFGQRFREHFGMTPAGFRRHYLAELTKVDALA
jgi:AraC-like DNA-binding protein